MTNWGNQNLYGAGNYNAGQVASNGVITVFVSNENSATAYPVAAGNMVSLVDLDHGKMWFKSTEANGMPCPLRTFEIKEVTPQPALGGDVVTRKEFDVLSAQIQQIADALHGLLTPQAPQMPKETAAKMGGRPK